MRALPTTALALAAVVATACGDDDDAPPPPRKVTPAAAAAGAPAAAGGPAAGALTTYAKIEGRPELKPGEAKTLRHVFTASDFEGDPTGSANRDPFRSYVVTQISTNTGPRPDADAATRAEKCANKKVAAADTSIQQLRLIGVISRGTMRVATFADAGGVGWVVRLGDCIGTEHARVKLIGEGFVTLENPVIPTTADPNPAASSKDFRLRDKELIDEMQTGDDDLAPRIHRRARTPDLSPPPEAPPSTTPAGGAQ